MAKRPKLKTVHKELWELCKLIIRTRYPNVCYTCGCGGLKGQNWQTGHAYPSRVLGVKMKYDLRILRPQCYNCNINLGGMGAVFWKRLETEMGKKKADNLYAECINSKSNLTNTIDYILKLIPKYQKILKGRRAGRS